ncbi:MAG TPA: spondin domain-containing protein [Thermodesulfobacteriota bacterium]|nr:spondin domain-containing protein [Thermodesulfobacteriota bacterium]
MNNFTKVVKGTLFGALLIASTVTGGMAEEGAKFKVRIENISKGEILKLSNGGSAPFALSPGMWVVHTGNDPLFTADEKDRGKGLEAQAEDGNPEMLVKSLEGQKGVMSTGIFNTPVGAKDPGPIVPGGAYEFTFTAVPGARLSFALMFGQSNDLFYAPEDKGINLFDGKKPISGDITSEVTLWDAGTEVNQEPGSGPDQAPRQSSPNTGANENGVVRQIKDVKDGFTYPKTEDVMRVTITPEGSWKSSKR